MKWNVFNSTDDWLGVVQADSEAEALKAAVAMNPDAQRVEEKQEHVGRNEI